MRDFHFLREQQVLSAVDFFEESSEEWKQIEIYGILC